MVHSRRSSTMTRIKTLRVLSLLFLSRLCLADQNANYNNNGNNQNAYYNQNGNAQNGQNNGENQGDQQYAQEDEQVVNYDDNGNYQSEVQICSDGVLQVKDISVYCDSPGTFYYGSGKYRNSPTCLPGDKAQIQIDFYIAQPEIIFNNGGYVLVDVSASGNYGKSSKTVYESADLCSLSTLTSRKNQCPFAGNYYIKTHFYWDKSDGTNGQTSFYPKVTVGFKSSLNKNVYDYGGANTNLCRGSTFITWSDGVAVTYANAVGNFIKSFGILLCTMVCLGVFIWVLARRPSSSIKGAVQKLGRNKRNQGLMDDEFDFNKMRKFSRQQQDVLDF